jgi:hypothetical protein
MLSKFVNVLENIIMISKLKVACAVALLCIAMPTLAATDEHGSYSSKDGSAHEGTYFQHHLKDKLDKLSERLEIKASQQSAWEEYAKSVEILAEHSEKKPAEDADATAISRYRAERAAEFAKKLTRIADATSKLQAVLTEDQKKIFNQISRHSHHKKCHGWEKHGGPDREWPHGAHGKDE